MAAPSGKFWIPIPRASARAPDRAAPSPACWAARAKDRPTAIPSGMLCSVTANTSMVLFFQSPLGPSGFCASRCRWGISRSNANRKPMPKINPAAARDKRQAAHILAHIHSRDQKGPHRGRNHHAGGEAKRAFCTTGRIPLRRKYTQARPPWSPKTGHDPYQYIHSATAFLSPPSRLYLVSS